MEGYLIKQEQLIERKWLTEEIQAQLLGLDFKTKGILVTADMGYGKSAFISHLICSRKPESGWKIRQRILAYHICRFDVLSSKNPAIFIQRLIGMIGMYIPEFGSHVSMLPNTSIIFDIFRCEQDPNGCFDQGVLFPLQNLLESPTEKRIIIIDALDECSEEYKGSNKISELIRRRAYKLPSWVVFLMTSRNTTEANLFKDIQLKHLSSSDPRNYDDIKAYIKDIKGLSILESPDLFGTDSNTDRIDKLAKASDGNFLFLTHALAHWMSLNGTFTKEDIPYSLDRTYELNFERIFGADQTDFQNAKTVLEIVCASIHQLKESEMKKILAIRNSTFASGTEYTETMAQLSMFLKVKEGVLTFTHISIRYWLLSDNNLNFGISIKHGAAILSEYLMEVLKLENDTSNVAQLALHVSRAGNVELEETFRSITKSKSKILVDTHVLHHIIDMDDSPNAINLISSEYRNIDQPNDQNLTASCLAALKGHLKSLERLIELGANINITIETTLKVIYYRYEEAFIDVLKSKYLSGYNLLHIASQFGHLSVVDYLISKQPSLIYSENMFGHLPVHTACEFGRKDSVQRFLLHGNITPDFTCLYLASKNQHEDVVKLLLDTKRVQYRCISEMEAHNMFDSLRVFKVTVNNGDMIGHSNEYIRPLDVWWIIKQDTPLHVSIRNGNLRISRLIASGFPSSLSCVDGGGLTPFLTSVRYQKYNIFKEFLNDRFSDVCKGPTETCKLLATIYGHNIYTTCEKGMTLSHLLAMYGNYDMLLLALKTLHEFQYDVKDITGVSPLHLAACVGNMHFLFIAHKLKANFKISTINGSTPYHSAAVCRSFIGISVLKQISGIPYIEDNSNMSLGLYLVSAPANKIVNRSDTTIHDNEILSVELLWNTSIKFITNVDKTKRNIFHYALLYGHYRLVYYFLSKESAISVQLLLQNDENGENPIAYAVRHLHDSDVPFVYYYPTNCSYIDIFVSVECFRANSLELLMSPTELSLLYVMMFARNTEVDSAFANHFGKLIVQSKMYLVLYFLIRISNNISNSLLKPQVKYAIDNIPEPHNIFTLTLIRPDILIHCDRTFSEPPLHTLAKYMDRIMDILGENTESLLKEMFKTKTRKHVLMKCLDQRKRNIVQRSVQDGSVVFAKYLIKFYSRELSSLKDLNELLSEIVYSNLTTHHHRITIRKLQAGERNIFKKAISGQRIVNNKPATKLVFTFKFLEGEFKFMDKTYENISNTIRSLNANNENEVINSYYDIYSETTFLINKDELINQMLLSFRVHLNFSKFCSSSSATFSLIHLVAASDFHKTMLTITKHAPLSVINCANRDGVTPLYLAKIFKADKTANILEKKTRLTLPNKLYEEIFFFKLLSTYRDSNIDDPLFFSQNYIPSKWISNEHRINILLKGMDKLNRACLLHKHIYSKHLPLRFISFIRSTRSILSLTRTILFSKGRYYPCYRFKNYLIIYQNLLRHILGNCPCGIESHLLAYQDLWQDITLFRNFEKCTVMRGTPSIVLKLRHFSKYFLAFLMRCFHDYLHTMAVKQAKFTIDTYKYDIFRKEKYYKKFSHIDVMKPETIQAHEFVRFRYIDVLKGVFIKTFGQNFKTQMFSCLATLP